VIRDKLV